MPAVGFETWFPKTSPTVFVVKNIAPEGKRIKIFNFPINNGEERDLMSINFVSEADIRHSLLKGELLTKLRSREAIVTACNIDLLQFDDVHKAFLRSVGVVNGLEAGGGSGPSILSFAFKQGISLIGDIDGANRTFRTPEVFINSTYGNNKFSILVRHNGRVLAENSDYFVAEGGGAGTGFNTIILTFSPGINSIILADYVVTV